MCRLLGLFSLRRSSAYGPLLETDRSLWRQSFADPKQPQGDGWGLAWYEGARPRLFKSSGPLVRQKAILGRAAARARGRIILFHLRRASNPRGLPLKRLRGRLQVQPFCFGPWSFVHNGSLPHPDETAARLGPYRRRVRGLNDSETLFWLLMRELKTGRDVAAALRRARRALKDVCRRSAPPDGSPAFFHWGLNVLLSDGERLWAYAEAPPGAREARALCSKDWPYFDLAFLPAPDRVWVASEPLWTGPRWRRVRSGELLEVRRDGDRVRWRKKKLV